MLTSNNSLLVVEGVRVPVEDDGGRRAAEGALRARVLVGGQAVDRLAGVIVDSP